MTSFVRLFGGALGVLPAVALASGAGIPPLDMGSLGGMILLAGWIGAKVIQHGKEPGQGLAYLDDGTMIVVEGGGTILQREVDVSVVRVLQTVAGRMVFARPR